MTTKPITIEEILHGYERRRLDNKRILQERRDKIYEQLPRLSELDSELTLSYLQAARARINGDDSQADTLKAGNRIRSEQKKKLLLDNGYPANYLEPIYTCPKCQDTGYVNQQKCSCFMKQIIDSLYIQSNLDNILKVENFNTFSTEYYSKEVRDGYQYSPYDNMISILSKCRDYTRDFKTNHGNILLYGETGLGKTFLTNCIAKELLDNGISVLYLSANELFETVLSGYLMNKKLELEDLYRYIYNSELLIIDDLGTELTNNFVLSQLFEIINQRELNNASTLISTNLSMKQLRDRYSERIMSRIIANYTVFNIYGDNIRYQKRKKAINSIT